MKQNCRKLKKIAYCLVAFHVVYGVAAKNWLKQSTGSLKKAMAPYWVPKYWSGSNWSLV